MTRLPGVKIQLVEVTVNKYSVMGSVWKLIKDTGHDGWAEEFKIRAHYSKSDKELLDICREYIEVIQEGGI